MIEREIVVCFVFSVSVACEGVNAVKLFTVHDAKMYSRFGFRTCLTMAVTGGCCCSLVLVASNKESREDSVQWAYPSPYDDEDKEEEDAERTFYVLRRLELSLCVSNISLKYIIYRKIRLCSKIQT